MKMKQEIECGVCKNLFPKYMMSIECPNCYLKGFVKELKKAESKMEKKFKDLKDKFKKLQEERNRMAKLLFEQGVKSW